MNKTYDLIVIGVGMAGLNAARRTASAGKSVAVVDSRPYGGTCALRGCDPKKVLVGAAEVLDWQRRMNGYGVDGELSINWSDLMAFKRTFTEPIPQNLENNLGKLGVATYHGAATFIDPTTLQVGADQFSFKQVIIATGSMPRPLEITGEALVKTSTDFLELEQLPKRLLFIGGGYISFEFAHIAARAGAEVTIVHRGTRVLEGFEAELVEQLVRASQDLGIRIELEREVSEVIETQSGFEVKTKQADVYEADLVFHGAGRVPELDHLALKKANVAFDSSTGVEVNEYLQSVSNPNVYAAGDSANTQGLPLTPVAVAEGLVAASNLLKGNQRVTDYNGTPSVVFTIPALARAGLDEAQATALGLKFSVNRKETSAWYTSRRTNESHSAFKVLVEDETNHILGAHLLGGYAGEVINMFALAIRHRLTAQQLKTSLYVHPAASSDISYMV